MDESRWTEPGDAGAGAGDGASAGGAGAEPAAGAEAGSSRRVGITGWRKRCLFAVVVLLVFLVTLNLTLVLWIMKVVHFNTNGVNYIQMVHNGVQLSRKTYIQDTLVASRVFTPKALSIQSAHYLSMGTTDRAGHPASSLLMANNTLEISTPSFLVTNSSGHTIFSVDKDYVTLDADSLPIFGEGGTALEGTLQTPKVSADIRSDLVLESVTSGVEALSSNRLAVESLAGDIQAASTEDITLTANYVDGSIRLESPLVLMPTLRHSMSEPPARHHQHQHAHQHAQQHAQQHARKHRHRPDQIYQLCICANGLLFLGEADAFCDTGFGNELCQQ